MEILIKRLLISGPDRWLVTEVAAHDIPGALADRCLVFQSEHVARRLWHYPANWYSLSDYALAALGEGRLADVAERPAAAQEGGALRGGFTGGVSREASHAARLAD